MQAETEKRREIQKQKFGEMETSGFKRDRDGHRIAERETEAQRHTGSRTGRNVELETGTEKYRSPDPEAGTDSPRLPEGGGRGGTLRVAPGGVVSGF